MPVTLAYAHQNAFNLSYYRDAEKLQTAANEAYNVVTRPEGGEGDYDAVSVPHEGTASFQPSTPAAKDSVVYETV